jgi:hypothetical protein
VNAEAVCAGVMSRDCIIGANAVPYQPSVTVFRDFDLCGVRVDKLESSLS